MATMLTHPQVWVQPTALRRVMAIHLRALRKGRADPTSFNKSKRITPEGRPCWPSTESVKVLQATGALIDEFISLLTKKERKPKRQSVDRFRRSRQRRLFRRRRLPGRQRLGRNHVLNVDDDNAYASGLRQLHGTALPQGRHPALPLARRSARATASWSRPRTARCWRRN